jgi:organic radical activating enzyme
MEALMSLKIREIFKSIQGEGPHAGRPAIFIRLAGCNLACDFCDTDHYTSVTEMAEKEVLKRVQELSMDTFIELIVITGGEPLLQNITNLVSDLLDYDFEIQLETNGTQPISDTFQTLLDDHSFAGEGPVDFVCSPKKGHPVHDSIQNETLYWKYLVDVKDKIGADGIPEGCSRPTEDHALQEIFLQPVDNHNAKQNARITAELCIKHGHRLSMQLHKIVGIA